MGYYNLPPAAYAEDLSEFEKLLRALPLEGAIQALDLLETLSRNIIQNPAEPKYRRLRTGNEKLAPLFGLPGASEVMADMGWRPDGEFVELPKEIKLDFQGHIVKILEAKSYFGKQREDAKRSAKLAASADSDKSALLRQLELDRRDRTGSRAAPQQLPIAVARPTPTAVPAAAQDAPAAAQDAPAAAQDAPAAAKEPCSLAAEADPATKAKPAAATATRPPKSAFDFEKRVDLQEKIKTEELSLQELRAKQKEKYKAFQDDPNAANTEAYQRPPSSANGSAQEPGWFDWLWGSSSGSGGSGGSDDRRQPPPGPPRMKTMRDLPQPVRRGGG